MKTAREIRDFAATWKSKQFTFTEAKSSEQTHWKIELGKNFGSVFVGKLTPMHRKVESSMHAAWTPSRTVTNRKTNLKVRAILERKWVNLVTECVHMLQSERMKK